MNWFFALFVFVGFSANIISQDTNYNKQIEAVQIIVDGYNQQNFRMMQKPWGIIGKVLISSKRLEEEFQPHFEKHGIAEIDSIVFTSKYNCTAQLLFKSHPDKRNYLTFNFSEKGKVQGLGFGYPVFIYRKAKSPNQISVSLEERQAKINAIVSKYSNYTVPNSFNGCLMVTKGNEVIYKVCSGYLDYDNQELLNDSSIFLLASCSKQFTAVAIMQLQEQGKLNYSDKVSTYLPEFPYENITIDNLLTHTSGLPDYFTLLKKYWDKTKYATNPDILNLLHEHKPILYFNPNEHFKYSNTGYVILSLLIEKIAGTTYNDYLTKNVFEPLQMKHTYVYNRRAQGDTLKNYAKGYVYSTEQNKYMLPDSLVNYNYVTYMDKITGDDGVSSCILDLKIWNEALENNTLISKKSTQLAYTPHILNNGSTSDYGYGFILKKGDAIEDIVFHTGSWPGYATMIFRLVERDESIIILSNNGYDFNDFLVDEICIELLKN